MHYFEKPHDIRHRRLRAHESTHWAIGATLALSAEKEMRRLKKKGRLYCNESWAKNDATNTLIENIFEEFNKFAEDVEREQKNFDDETDHGFISDKEEEWEKRYDVH